jgi:hypothetical protein
MLHKPHAIETSTETHHLHASARSFMPEASKVKSYDLQTKQGYAFVYKTLGNAFLNVPTEDMLNDVARIGKYFGNNKVDFRGKSTELESQFYNRFIVPNNEVFFPLSEGHVEDAAFPVKYIAWDCASNTRSNLARLSYEKAGFSYHAVRGFPLMMNVLRADTLGCELVFLSYLKHASLSQDDSFNMYDHFTHEFIQAHTSWFDKAAELMGSQDDDFYARLVGLSAEVVRSDLEFIGSATAQV